MTDLSTRHGVLKANDPCWCGSGKKFKRCHKAADANVRPGRISPTRAVPTEIPRPPYAESGQAVRHAEDPVQSPDVIERMRGAGRAAAEVLEGRAAVRPGITTTRSTASATRRDRRGGYPSTLNYRGFPKSLCTSVNEVICHGIPDTGALDGDIVNIDVTVFLDGVHGDTNARSRRRRRRESRRSSGDRECLEHGIAVVSPGRPQRHRPRHPGARRALGFGVVRDFIGHGIGEQFHSGPQVPHYFEPRTTASSSRA